MEENDVLTKLIGAPVIAAERFGAGFENRTDKVTLANGEVQIVQRITNRALASHKLRLAQLLPERLLALGIRTPRLLRADADANPPYAVREFVEGIAGPALLDQPETAQALAEAMGAVLPLLAQVPTAGLGLHTGWANPARLAQQAHSQLQRRSSLIAPAHIDALAATIAQVEPLFAGRPGVFAHGDFCPINVLVEGAGDWELGARNTSTHPQPPAPSPQPLVLIDLEFARLADPLFDAAWWGWVVRYHHAERWRTAFPQLLAAAGIANDVANRERIQVIQRLRLLEALDYNAALSSERGAIWAERLATTLGWNA